MKTKEKVVIGVVALIFLVVVGILGYAVYSSFQPDKSSSKNPAGNPTQQESEMKSSEIDGVTVDAEPKTISSKQNTIISLIFTTHQGSLDFDVDKVAILEDNLGNKYSPIKWEGSPKGGHHRNGDIIFPPVKDGISSIKLIISEDAGISEREFEWEAK